MRNPLSIEAFADWCEKRPESEEYDYYDTCGCACAQYARHLGIPYSVAVGKINGTFWQRAEYHAATDPETFSALAKRLREAA